MNLRRGKDGEKEESLKMGFDDDDDDDDDNNGDGVREGGERRPSRHAGSELIERSYKLPV